jgi:hypothetical protein
MTTAVEIEQLAREGAAFRNAEAQVAAKIDPETDGRSVLEAKYGQVWNTEELQRDFEVLGFAMCLCVVRRRSDGVKGSIEFGHSPRFYYSFTPA